LFGADRATLDLSNSDSILRVVRQVRPRVIVNAAAYTAVDRAEDEEALAMRVNADGPAILAEEAAKHDALLVHFSTDYVFDGEKRGPYTEVDLPNPLSAYGRTKLAGENAIQTSSCRHLIFRTSWIYGPTGRNFLLTMLRLASPGKLVRVVNDQYGAPTSSAMVAAAVPKAITLSEDASMNGVYHMTASGSTTWYGFARAILEPSRAEVQAISSAEYTSPVRRPRNSLLDNSKLDRHFGLRLPPWEDGLRQVLQQLKPIHPR
jgi:dTDP-4-dehydrorhamnose reductase